MANTAQDAFTAFNPFKDMDITKFMSEMKIPTLSFETLAESQRKNFEAFTAANQSVFEGFQALMQRQAEVLRSTIEEFSNSTSDLMATASPEEKAGKQADLMKRNYEKAIANVREMIDIVAKSNGEALDVINKRVTETLDEVKALVSKAK